MTLVQSRPVDVDVDGLVSWVQGPQADSGSTVTANAVVINLQPNLEDILPVITGISIQLFTVEWHSEGLDQTINPLVITYTVITVHINSEEAIPFIYWQEMRKQ